MEVKRLFDYLTKQLQNQADAPFISAKEFTSTGIKEWNHYSYQAFQDWCNKVSLLLLSKGLQPGDKIAIISANRAEWNMVDIGSQQIGLVNVPMYPSISEDDYAFIFRDAQIRFAFVGDSGIYQKVKSLQEKIQSLQGIISFDKIEGVSNFWEALKLIDSTDFSSVEARKALVKEHDVATIIYTSGTTGNPKGVMLTHQNIVSNLTGISQVLPFLERERALSFLPLCHSFERTVFFAYLMIGIHIYYAESLETIGENLQEVKPYCFTTVPRLLEKVYEKIMAKGNALSGFKKKLFFWSIALGEQYELGVHQGFWYQLKLYIARLFVFSKWQLALGGNIRFIVTGAAAMQPRLIKLFAAANVHVIEGYGLTETSPVLSVNGMLEQERCVGSIGMPIPGVEIKLAADGEIIARGKNIMKGYYNRPDLTAEVIDADGWFHTGDIGTWVTHFGKQFLKITDRKKELFKTAGGKYIAPQAIENKMKESSYIEQLLVVGGDDKKYIGALIVPSLQQVKAWANQNNILFSNETDLVQHPKVIALIQHEVDSLNTHFGKWEQIKRFKLLEREWTIEQGYLTPTMKLKRKILHESFRREIEDIFNS
ncbi:MAG: long-chain fatty acid--CoA ligase [Chitinophagales bacterium]|nr:long-chain fatty acid--CoA ligase [Chitinophagales bacterium]